MGLSVEWRALQHESQLAAVQVATGVTALGQANYAQTGLYSIAFSGLSIGLERLGKLIIVADLAIRNNGSFPTNSNLKQIGHQLQDILTKCETIGKTVDADREYSSRPTDLIHQGIEETLSDFAVKSRYYNLEFIGGAAEQQTDPIALWWYKVAKPIIERHYSSRQRMADVNKGLVTSQLIGNNMIVHHHGEDDVEINDIGDFFARPGAIAVVQKYGRLYTLQIVRWLASMLSELSHCGAYQKRIEPLIGLDEPFAIFGNEDQYLRDRKTWSIYRP